VSARSDAWRWFALAAAVVLADQAVKWLVLASLRPYERVEVTGFLNIVLVFNKGAAFSFLAQESGWQRPLFIAFALAASAVLSVLIVRNPGKALFRAGLALVLGGALGNVIDRIRFGHVVDFVDLHALGWHWPAFNVADSGITVGAAILIFESFLHDGRKPAAGGRRDAA
jgi:signal peptidase II